MGSGQSCVTQQMQSPNALGIYASHMHNFVYMSECTETQFLLSQSTGSQNLSENEDISWLHRNDTYQRTTTTENYTPSVIATTSSMRNHINNAELTDINKAIYLQAMVCRFVDHITMMCATSYITFIHTHCVVF